MNHRFSGRFEDWSHLGEGGEGKLYRVRDRWTGRMSALKVAGVMGLAGLAAFAISKALEGDEE